MQTYVGGSTRFSEDRSCAGQTVRVMGAREAERKDEGTLTTRCLDFRGEVSGTNQPVRVDDRHMGQYRNTAEETSMEGDEVRREVCYQYSEFTLAVAGADGAGPDQPRLLAAGRTVSFRSGGELSVEFCLTSPVRPRTPAKPAPYHGTYRITGGTGRYAGARGTGMIIGLDYGNGVFRHRYHGTMTLPANAE